MQSNHLRIRYVRRQMPQAMGQDDSSSPSSMETGSERKRGSITEAKNASEALELLERIAALDLVIPESIFTVLKADELSKQDVKDLLSELELKPATTAEEKNALEKRANQLFCPINLTLMRDPIMADDGDPFRSIPGNTYELMAFQQAVAAADHLEIRGILGSPLRSLAIKKNKNIRLEIINILKIHAKNLLKKESSVVIDEKHILTSPSAPLKNIMWPSNPGAFAHYHNPFVRLALSQLRNPALGIQLADIVSTGGRLILETKEGSLSAQEKLTEQLRNIFPARENDVATVRIPSEAVDRMFGNKFNWESNAIEGVGGQQENWRTIANELGREIKEITPVMTREQAAEAILTFLQRIINPVEAFGNDAKVQQNKLQVTPEVINVILKILAGVNYDIPIDRIDLHNLEKILLKFKTAVDLVESQTAYDKNGKALIRIQIHQPIFEQMLKELGAKFVELESVISRSLQHRYRTVIRESFVTDATALASGGTRAKAAIEFKGIHDKEAYFAVKGQLPKIQSDTNKRFVFKFDCSGSMNFADLEQLKLIEDLFREKYTTHTWDEGGNSVVWAPEEDFIKDKMKLNGQQLAELAQFLEEKQRKEGQGFPEHLNDIIAALKTPACIPTRLYYAKKAFKAAYEQLKNVPNARLTLLKFGNASGGEVVYGYSDVAMNDPSVPLAIDNIVANHEGTYFIPGVRTMLSLRRPGEDLIEIGVTDGQTTEMMNGQSAEQIKEAVTREFSLAGFLPTTITVGYKFNEIREKTEEETKKSQAGAEQVIKDYALISGPGSEVHTIKQSHRLAEVFANKGKEFVKRNVSSVYLKVDESKTINLAVYPNQYFEKMVRIPVAQDSKLSLPDFGEQKIDFNISASSETIALAHICEIEKLLLDEGIDPRVSSTFATQKAKMTIALLRQQADQIGQQAVVSYLDRVLKEDFTPALTNKTTPVKSIIEDKEIADFELSNLRRMREEAAKADSEEGVRTAAMIEFRRLNCVQPRSRYTIRRRVTSASEHKAMETSSDTQSEEFKRQQLQKREMDYIDEAVRNWRAAREGKASAAEQKDEVRPHILDIRSLHENEMIKGQYYSLLQGLSGSFAESTSSNIRPITDQGAVFMFDWDDTIIKGQSNNTLVKKLGWPDEKKFESNEQRHQFVQCVWDIVKDMEPIGMRWLEWGQHFRELLQQGHAVAIASLNVYGQIIIPLFMKEKMGLTTDEIKQITIASYQIQSNEMSLDADHEFGKENHVLTILESKQIPLNKPKFLIDDNKRNVGLFDKNAQATHGRELDQGILADETGTHIQRVKQLAGRYSRSKPMTAGASGLFPPANAQPEGPRYAATQSEGFDFEADVPPAKRRRLNQVV